MRKVWINILERITDGLERSTVGTIVMLCCMGLIAYLCIREGGTDIVDDLITTAMIVAASLMGVTSIADIFKVERSSSSSTQITVDKKDNTERTITERHEETTRDDD